MALRQCLQNFRCGASTSLRDQATWKKIVDHVSGILGEGTVVGAVTDLENGKLWTLVNAQTGSHATVRTELAEGKSLLLLDIIYPARLNLAKSVEDLRRTLCKELDCPRLCSSELPAIRHGDGKAVDGSYMPTVDGRWVEYDFTDLVYERDTPYQNVCIYSSGQYGGCLVLDGDMNLAESDLPYTLAIIGDGLESYKNKRVLILGGGDGGILNQLMKREPAYVEMVEIDQAVIDGAVKHLRGICGSAMDKLEGPNYKVRVEDCIPAMKEHIANGTQFDFVINDLTAIPISTSPHGSFWDFMREILDLSFQVLKPDGVYYTQGNSACAQPALAMYESELMKLTHRVDFVTSKVCVPSYNELWVFYEIWRKDHEEARAANRLKPLSR